MICVCNKQFLIQITATCEVEVSDCIFFGSYQINSNVGSKNNFSVPHYPPHP